VIAGTRFPARIRAVFAEQRPEIVFHAAAQKHVRLMGGNPGEAITTAGEGERGRRGEREKGRGGERESDGED